MAEKKGTGPINTIKTAQELGTISRATAMELSRNVNHAILDEDTLSIDGCTPTQSTLILSGFEEKFIVGKGEYPFLRSDAEPERWTGQ